ncbi:MAG: hypothetical protein DRN81_06165, partial [Thermoproteota archaeon]
SAWTSFTEMAGQAWDNVVNAISDAISEAVDWLSSAWNDFTNMVGSAWDNVVSEISGSIESALSWMSDAFMGALDWINEIGGDIAGFIGDRLDEVYTYIVEEVPNMVSGLFDWAKPVVDPIINAAGWLEKLTNVFTGKYEEDPEMEKIRQEREKIMEEIRRITGHE